MSLVRYLLCDPAAGPNLRNEVAHCTVNPGRLSASRVFLVALLCIRLTLMQPSASPAPSSEEEDEPDDSEPLQ